MILYTVTLRKDSRLVRRTFLAGTPRIAAAKARESNPGCVIVGVKVLG